MVVTGSNGCLHVATASALTPLRAAATLLMPALRHADAADAALLCRFALSASARHT